MLHIWTCIYYKCESILFMDYKQTISNYSRNAYIYNLFPIFIHLSIGRNDRVGEYSQSTDFKHKKI